MKSKKMLWIILIMTVAGIVLKANDSRATLQSNGGSPATKNINDWIIQIRQMQATGGTLGLTDSINGTNLTSGNKNLDIHMQKNTEYGAMVILSASAYGNPNHIADGQTTTGNQTGVLMKINKEWVAAGLSNTAVASMKNAQARYKNVYPTPAENKEAMNYYEEKIGDAIATTGKWHGSTSTTWISSMHNTYITVIRSGLLRAYSGSIFSYYGFGYDLYSGPQAGDSAVARRDADYRKTWASRAVVVVGSGI